MVLPGRLLSSRWILFGYGLALAAAIIAVRVRDGLIPADVAQASSGMVAFGDMLLFCGVFAFTALFPTSMLLHRLRRSERFWRWITAGAITWTATGLAALALHAWIAFHATAARTWVVPGFLVMMRILAVVPGAATLLFTALNAPRGRFRPALLCITAIDTAIGTSLLVDWMRSARLF